MNSSIQRCALFVVGMVYCANMLFAQYTYTDSIQWQTYEDFNSVFLDTKKYIYRDHSAREDAVDRWNGAAAIWCQAIYYDMVQNAYRRAVKENDTYRKNKYKLLHNRIYAGMKRQYVNFDFHDPNTNTGWFVYDDIMWWTASLARAYQTFEKKEYLTYSEQSFCRVWYGSEKVGDDGSYADPARGLGGGMFWEWQPIDNPKPHKAGDFRSACINFPTVIAACTLYDIVPEDRTSPTGSHPTYQTKEWYKEKAIEIFEWADGTLVQNGRVADGIHDAGPEFKDHLYNQGTYIGAGCLLYKITGEQKYLDKAVAAANYVFKTMSSNYILPLETGIEQGVYAAIFAQYMHMLVYDCGQTRFLSYLKRNMQKGYDYMDKTRGISNGYFLKRTEEGSQIESYPASGLPALMLLFPMGDSQTGVEQIQSSPLGANQDEVYSLGGKNLSRNSSSGLNNLKKGLYIVGGKKTLVR